jgi:3'(2'), 5'-bisphosphate nucleotidase
MASSLARYAVELEVAEKAAIAAGTVIRAYYDRGGVDVELKQDTSPVTVADRDANAAILDILRSAFPTDAVLSEESTDDLVRLERSRVWIVDPLDGTRDFIARTGEFAVHVGFAVEGVAVVGAVYRPVSGELYSARAGHGATCKVEGAAHALRVSPEASPDGLRIGVSRLNSSALLSDCLAAGGLTARAVAMGASVKHMAVAGGRLDAVIGMSPSEHDWDTCAPEVIVREAGGVVTDGDGTPFRYNQRDTSHPRGSLVSNGACHAELLAIMRPFVARLVP